MSDAQSDGRQTAEADLDAAEADYWEARRVGDSVGVSQALDRYHRANTVLIHRADSDDAPNRTAFSESRDDVPPDRFPCVSVESGETTEEAQARHPALAESHESVLAALARILFGREEAQREEPWTQPCIRTPEDDRGLER